MNIQFDMGEITRLALDRDVTLRKLVHDYVDEYILLNPTFLFELEDKLRSRAFRCIKCGYWVGAMEVSESDVEVCEICDEE